MVSDLTLTTILAVCVYMCVCVCVTEKEKGGRMNASESNDGFMLESL